MPRGNTDNLTPFNTLTVEEQRKIQKKGGKKSGEVRRKKANITKYIEKELLTKKDGEKIEKKVAKKLIDMALNGDIVAIKELLDRVDGKTKEIFDVTSDVKQEVVMRFGWAARAGRPDKQIEEEREDS